MVAMRGPSKLASKRLPSPSCATATDAEILSLALAPRWAAHSAFRHLSTCATLHFFSDSLTALKLVRDWPSAPGAHLLPQWKNGIQTLLDSFPTLQIVYHWSPGHSGILGNEWADEEAKGATSLPPSSDPPSISALKERNTLQAQAKWEALLTPAMASTADKYLAVSGIPSRRPRRLLTMSTSHPRHELSAMAQVLCGAGPFGGYWLCMSAEYRHLHGLISHCRWHNHPPWPSQSVAHILGGCSTFRPWIVRIWPTAAPLPVHHSQWADEPLLPVLRKWSISSTNHHLPIWSSLCSL